MTEVETSIVRRSLINDKDDHALEKDTLAHFYTGYETPMSIVTKINKAIADKMISAL